MEREEYSSSLEMDVDTLPKTKARRRRKYLGIIRRTASLTIATVAFSPIAGAFDAIPSAALVHKKGRNFSTSHRRNLRNLQGDIQQCKIALAVGDINRDDLLSQSEYLRFVKQLGNKMLGGQNNDYVSLSSFDKLPEGLKENYSYFSDTELLEIDISGSKPGQTATSEQDMKLDELCDFTTTKIRDPNSETGNTNDPQKPPNSNPTDDFIPSTGTDCSGTIDRGKCNIDLSISDSYRDDLLDESDYVKFVNRLSRNAYAGYDFEQLPQNIQANYYRFATTDGQVNISGSKPGQRVSVEQDRFLNAFCCETDLAIQNPGSSGETPEKPDEPETLAPTVELFFCQRSMASSDLDRNDELTKEEYVIFLNRLTNNQYIGETYDTLDVALQENFLNLAGDNGKIDIYGSKPGQVTNYEEDEALIQICVETGYALNGESAPTAASPATAAPSSRPTLRTSLKPTSAPVPAPAEPTAEPEASDQTDVYNSFIISNQGGLSAADLIPGTANRDGLDRAYGVFAQTTVENVGLLEVRSLRRRKLAVGFLPESAEIYEIVDIECPSDFGLSPIDSCQTAFAKFKLLLEGQNAQVVSDLYTNYTQAEISAGELEVILKEVDKRTLLKIVDASYPTRPGEDNSETPTDAPTKDENGQKKNRAGPIVGGIFGAIILFAIIGYISTRGLPFELPFELPSLPIRGGARVGNKAVIDDDDDDDERLAFGQDEDDPSFGDKQSFGKDFRNSFGDNDDDDGEYKEKKSFGFTSKHKKNDDDDDELNFGLESNKDLNANSADNLYEFEEPSEIDSETENQDGSAAENEDMGFGGKPGSSNWGTNNVFDSGPSNQGWGANEGEDNFFGSSAFGVEEVIEESASESEDSESYTSEDDTYQSGSIDESEGNTEQDSATYDDMDEVEEEDSFTGSSADDSYNSASLPSQKLSSDLRLKNEDMDAAIDNGDWDAVVEAAKAFDKGDQDSRISGTSNGPSPDHDEDINDLDDLEDESYGDSYSGSESATSQTTTSEDRIKRAEYRAQVEELVQIVLPDETEKVDAMMDQFKGREAELVSTLQTMEERSSNQRARAAIHKSKPPSLQQNSGHSQANGAGILGGEGSTAGTAAIAAASLPIPAEGVFEDATQNDFDGDFGDENAFGDEGDDQYEIDEGGSYAEEFDDQSYYSEGGDQSYYSGEEDSKSYYSEEEEEEEEISQPKSFYSQEAEGSQGESFFSQEGESIDESYYSEGGDQSYYSGEEEESYVSGDEGSFYSEEGSANDEE